jgi:ABC-type phosphate transport system substrate-binding protein
MKHFLTVLIVLCISLMMDSLFSQGVKSFKVIVNEENSVSALTKDNVSNYFLKKTIKWDNGSKIEPVDLGADSDTRKSFSENIHGKSVSAIKAYWQKKIFSGKGIPPSEKSNDAEVLAFVKSKPGAIGYVSAGASTNGVKVVKITD